MFTAADFGPDVFPPSVCPQAPAYQTNLHLAELVDGFVGLSDGYFL